MKETKIEEREETKKTEDEKKDVITSRRTATVTGTGLSHYILMDKPRRMSIEAPLYAGGEGKAPSSGQFTNTGNGPTLTPLDIGHDQYMALVDPDTAFWSLVRKEKLAEALSEKGELLNSYRKKADSFTSEMEELRFAQRPSAVYFNPTERCNLNCSYCYIPEDMRRDGVHMSKDCLIKSLGLLKDYFTRTLPEDVLPQIVFHGAEPLLNRDAVFAGIEEYSEDFRFGIQTNATLLDDSAIEFLTSRQVSIGLSLDAPTEAASDLTRKSWDGTGIYNTVIDAMKKLRGYEGWSVICTITSENTDHLTELVELFHKFEAPTCLMNIVRCTLPASRKVMPTDVSAARHCHKSS